MSNLASKLDQIDKYGIIKDKFQYIWTRELHTYASSEITKKYIDFERRGDYQQCWKYICYITVNMQK